MEGTTEKDCSPLWNLYQQIVTDMKNSAPMWEEFISKATKLHSALKSALVAIATFLDAFQKIADAATNARGATKEIGTALTRVCLRHRAIETRMKTFISTLMERLIAPLSERADEWRRGCNVTGALSREHARECKRARAELRRRVHDAQRHARKARRTNPDVKRRADVCLQDIQERKQQLEEMEEKAVKAALIEERSRFCNFVSLLSPVVESEVAMLAEVSHLQEGTEQLSRQISEPRSLPPGSLQVICDIKSCYSGWAEGGSVPPSPSTSRLGSRKSSLTSISSLSSQCSDQHGVSGSTVSCSTPISTGSSIAPALDSQRGQGSDNQSINSECATPSKTNDENDSNDLTSNSASATWPDLKDTAQFERAASAIMGGRPHTISAGTDRSFQRPALSVHTFSENAREGIYARPPLPTRCSSLERPSVPARNSNSTRAEFKPNKPTSLPPHLAKEVPQALYVNMSELATMAASRAQQQNSTEYPQQEKVCSESSASESSLESSSGYGSQGAFAGEDHSHLIHPDVSSEIVTLRHSDSVVIARENFSISLGSLEEAVRCLDEASESPTFATIGKKPTVPKRRPVSMTAPSWSRRGSSSSQGKPPPPVRRSSSISRPRPIQNTVLSVVNSSDVDNLPPPPAFLLQPDDGNAHPGINVAETVKQLTELKHMPASPGLVRRTVQNQNENQSPIYGTQKQLYGTHNQNTPIYGTQNQNLSSFQQAKSNFSSSMSLNSGNLNPIYSQTGNRMFENSLFVRKNSLNSSNTDIYGGNTGVYETKSPHGSTPSTPSYSETNTFSSFGPRVTNESHYGQTGVKLQDQSGIYAAPSLVRRLTPRAHSAERNAKEHGGLIATLSAKLAPQLSPRSPRRANPNVTESPAKGKGVPATVQPAFLDKLSATLQHQRRMQSRANTVRDLINAHAQPDPRVCHTSLMEQIKRGATLRRNKYCNDRSAPKIR
ncbi:protein MTSS 1 isoform X2 [Danaus plexippus]|uniref:protein MTSS 1 isoform X2 n=1 Tax=Danaus plexippus TaxID=13037 RepID=UPI002AB1FF28|nr:protein MTSS 1 isoform X2 [Danaus plexippus]